MVPVRRYTEKDYPLLERLAREGKTTLTEIAAEFARHHIAWPKLNGPWHRAEDEQYAALVDKAICKSWGV